MRRQVDHELVGGLSFVVPGAGLAYMGLWGWGIAVFVTEVALIRLIGLPSGHPVIVWFVLSAICSTASAAYAKYHNERLMERLVASVEMSPPPPPPSPLDPSPPPIVAAATVATTIRFCPSCGTRNEGHRFCPQCGSSLQPAHA
jgi:ribosomal protein S27AE